VNTKVPALVVLASFGGMYVTAAMFSPLASYLPDMYPTRVRCSGATIGFQAAGIFGGAPAPLIAVPLVAYFGSSTPVAIYLALALVLVVISVLAARETAHIDLREVDAAAPGQKGVVAPA